MSVYTLLSQNQIEALLSQYDIHNLNSYAEISDGIENSNYLINAHNKEFVLTIFERASSVSLLPYLLFMATAQKANFAVPCPIENNQGERLSFFEYKKENDNSAAEQKRFILCEKLSGTHPKTISIELCEHLGEKIAGLHALPISPDLLDKFPMQELPSLIMPLNFKTLLSEEKLTFFKEEKSFIAKLNQQASLFPKGIAHCDFFPDNSLTITKDGKETISAFLDWYDARQTYLLLDLAIIAVSWCTNERHEMITEKESALLKGYQKVSPFINNELTVWNGFLRAGALFFWISREDYHEQMHLQGRSDAINPKKSTEEFWLLLQHLKLR